MCKVDTVTCHAKRFRIVSRPTIQCGYQNYWGGPPLVSRKCVLQKDGYVSESKSETGGRHIRRVFPG